MKWHLNYTICLIFSSLIFFYLLISPPPVSAFYCCDDACSDGCYPSTCQGNDDWTDVSISACQTVIGDPDPSSCNTSDWTLNYTAGCQVRKNPNTASCLYQYQYSTYSCSAVDRCDTGYASGSDYKVYSGHCNAGNFDGSDPASACTTGGWYKSCCTGAETSSTSPLGHCNVIPYIRTCDSGSPTAAGTTTCTVTTPPPPPPPTCPTQSCTYPTDVATSSCSSGVAICKGTLNAAEGCDFQACLNKGSGPGGCDCYVSNPSLPDCTESSYGSCTPNSTNACGTNQGTQTCTKTTLSNGSTSCNIVSCSQRCSPTCSSGTCVNNVCTSGGGCSTITLTASPDPVTLGNQLTLRATGDPSGYSDNITGGIGTCPGATATYAVCDTTTAGTFSWTRAWSENNQSCSASTTYTINGNNAVTLSGRVTNSLTASPIPNVDINKDLTGCSYNQLTHQASMVTDADGYFSATNVPYKTAFCLKAPSIPGYNSAFQSYNCQYAGGYFNLDACNNSLLNSSIDKNADNAYNFTYAPIAKNCTVSLLNGSSTTTGTPVQITMTGQGNLKTAEQIRLWVERQDGLTINPAPVINSASVAGTTYGSTTYYKLDDTCNTNTTNTITYCPGATSTYSVTLPAGNYYVHCDLQTDPGKCSGNPFCGTGCAGWAQCSSDAPRLDSQAFSVTAPLTTPWIQTTGDVHSNTGIHANGGP